MSTPTVASDNVMGHVWSKFVLNCAINPVAALTGLEIGDSIHISQVKLPDGVVRE